MGKPHAKTPIKPDEYRSLISELQRATARMSVTIDEFEKSAKKNDRLQIKAMDQFQRGIKFVQNAAGRLQDAYDEYRAEQLQKAIDDAVREVQGDFKKGKK